MDISNVSRYDTFGEISMIRSFRDKRTASVAAGQAGKGFPASLVAAAQRKLFMIEQSGALMDLRSPPGNRLEAL